MANVQRNSIVNVAKMPFEAWQLMMNNGSRLNGCYHRMMTTDTNPKVVRRKAPLKKTLVTYQRGTHFLELYTFGPPMLFLFSRELLILTWQLH